MDRQCNWDGLRVSKYCYLRYFAASFNFIVFYIVAQGKKKVEFKNLLKVKLDSTDIKMHNTI